MNGDRFFRWLPVLGALLIGSSLALSATQWRGFDGPSSRATTLAADYNGFYDDGSGEISMGWMHLIHLKQGGWISLLFTYADLGPYKDTSSVAVLHLKPDGTQRICSGTWQDKEKFSRPPPNKYRIGVDESLFGGTYPDFYVKLKAPECSGDISFHSLVPTFIQGSGKTTFYDDRSKYWRLITISPRSSTTGHIQFKDARIDVEGDAYLEEVATNVMVPKVSDQWRILRAVSGPYTINLFDIVVKKSEFGEGHIKTLMVARDAEILMGTTDFTYDPQGGTTDPKSGIKIPAQFNLSAKDGDTTLKGSIKTGTIMMGVSLLAKMSAVTRMVAGFMYGSPWQYRTAAEYDLVLREGDRETPIRGTGFKELHYYDN